MNKIVFALYLVTIYCIDEMNNAQVTTPQPHNPIGHPGQTGSSSGAWGHCAKMHQRLPAVPAIWRSRNTDAMTHRLRTQAFITMHDIFSGGGAEATRNLLIFLHKIWEENVFFPFAKNLLENTAYYFKMNQGQKQRTEPNFPQTTCQEQTP